MCTVHMNDYKARTVLLPKEFAEDLDSLLKSKAIGFSPLVRNFLFRFYKKNTSIKEAVSE